MLIIDARGSSSIASCNSKVSCNILFLEDVGCRQSLLRLLSSVDSCSAYRLARVMPLSPLLLMYFFYRYRSCALTDRCLLSSFLMQEPCSTGSACGILLFFCRRDTGSQSTASLAVETQGSQSASTATSLILC